jgi:hypothetical protein
MVFSANATGCSGTHIPKPEEIIMFRKISIALVAAAALGSAALVPTSASAWGRGGSFGGFNGRIS